MRRLSRERRIEILSLLVEGMSMRAIERHVGCTLKTVSRLLVDAGVACLEWHDQNVRGVRAQRIEADEIWSFTYCKQASVEYARRPPPEAGSTWTWTAMDPDTKLMISWVVGPRDRDSAIALMADLANRVVARVQLTTDGLAHYIPAVEYAFGSDVDFAQLVKTFSGSGVREPTPEEEMNPERRYSPPRSFSVTKTEVQGSPRSADISTSIAERQNLTLRMQNRRMTRLTNAFSKKLANHGHQMSLFVTHYNWCRIHKSLRMTPAMAAGLTDELRDMDWLIGLVEERDSRPGPRGTYRTTRTR